jgi:glycine cleavage system H protein
MSAEEIHYKRSRFSTRLLEHRLYTAGHSWLEQEDEHLWRVGFTKFAVRMLGEIVELGFETEPGTAVETGQVIG